MVHPTWRFLDLLKDYSNVLLALATLVYVALTYQMLKALRRESTRELRLRHLRDIKEQAVHPLHGWIETRAIPALKGEPNLQANVLVVSSTPVRRENVGLGESAYDYKRGLAVSLHPRDATPGHLYFHAKEIHFPKELEAAEHLLEEIEKLASDCLSVARNWADEMAKATTLPRVSATNCPTDCADSDLLATICLKGLIAGREPELRVSHPAPDVSEVSDYAGTVVARGLTKDIQTWYSSARKVAADSWQTSGLSDRFQEVLREAVIVSEYVGRLELTYDLRGDCEYIGGRNPGRIKRLWRRLRERVSGTFFRTPAIPHRAFRSESCDGF